MLLHHLTMRVSLHDTEMHYLTIAKLTKVCLNSAQKCSLQDKG